MKKIALFFSIVVFNLNAFSQLDTDKRDIELKESKRIIGDPIPLPSESFWLKNGSSIYYNSGNVGIGISTPSYKLQAQGDIYANGGWLRVSGTKGLYFQSYGGGFYMTDATWIRTYNNKSFYHNSGIMRTDGTFQVGPDGNRFVVNTNGNVGIGCDPGDARFKIYKSELPTFELASPKSKLQFGIATCDYCFAQGAVIGDAIIRNLGSTHNIILSMPDDGNDGKAYIGVSDAYNGLWFKIYNNRTLRMNGKLFATEIEVKTNIWSDFVFDEEYKLRTINELEKYIVENKHLPDVPSKDDVINNGINLGEMDAILLQKIEELTLYIIELKKENEELKKLFNDNLAK